MSNMSRKHYFLEVMQWGGATNIILGHVLNAVGPSVYPYNIIAFFIGTIMFLTWAVIIANKPQITVNFVSIVIGTIGLVKAFA